MEKLKEWQETNLDLLADQYLHLGLPHADFGVSFDDPEAVSRVPVELSRLVLDAAPAGLAEPRARRPSLWLHFMSCYEFSAQVGLAPASPHRKYVASWNVVMDNPVVKALSMQSFPLIADLRWRIERQSFVEEMKESEARWNAALAHDTIRLYMSRVAAAAGPLVGMRAADAMESARLLSAARMAEIVGLYSRICQRMAAAEDDHTDPHSLLRLREDGHEWTEVVESALELFDLTFDAYEICAEDEARPHRNLIRQPLKKLLHPCLAGVSDELAVAINEFHKALALGGLLEPTDAEWVVAFRSLTRGVEVRAPSEAIH